MTFLRNIAATALVLGLSAGAAAASTVTLEKTYANLFGDTDEQRLRESVSVNYGTETINAYAGAFRISEAQGKSFIAFCVELAEGLKLPFEFTKTKALFDAATTQRVAQLFGTAYEQVTDDTSAAAFQVSLWEIVTDQDGSLDLDDGIFVLNSGGDVRTTALGFLSGLSDPTDNRTNLTFYAAPGSQDVVTGTVSPVPVPAAGLLLIGGLGGLMVLRRARAAA
ncbi:hypothetical protein [Actibacterium sp. 188UL27-1]|uniref:hypothetical protein n=1 Tax=Actibacterium sp. 188UL27-1 TaxID=2786961 RepID=UPI00195CA7AE|nr:hypothetical protein [Actibacterium sp. 188UL27-1]MBM7066710.1 hypothetical protein [Actibacterium sp. 188UL27-1]